MFPQAQSNGGNSLAKLPSSQVWIACVKLIKINKHNDRGVFINDYSEFEERI